jgi:hypothetical protein
VTLNSWSSACLLAAGKLVGSAVNPSADGVAMAAVTVFLSLSRIA